MTATAFALILAVFAEILLTFLLLGLTGIARGRALRNRRLKPGNAAVSQEPWPDDVRKVSNSFGNQFETPVIFYVVALLALQLALADAVLAVLAWIWVATRLAHALVHVTSNFVPHRFVTFALGAGMLFAMTVWLFLRILAARAALV